MGKHKDTARPIRKEVHGKACPFCGENTYQLVLRSTSVADASSLFVRCRRCSHPTNLEGEFKSILWT